VDDDIRSHYVLTYHPRNLDFDGEFRAIEVKTPYEGLTIRARSGYWAIPPGASVLSAEEYKELLNPQHSRNEPALPFFCQVGYFLQESNRYQVYLTIELPIEEFDFQFQDGLNYVDLDVIGMVQNQNGEVMTSFRGPSRIKLASQQLVYANKIRLDSRFDLAPGLYSVSISVGNPVRRRIGFHQRGLHLPKVYPRLALSSLFLGRTDEMIPVRENDDFTVRDIHIFPSAARKFTAEEQLVYLFDIYRPKQEDGFSENCELRLRTELYHRGKLVTALPPEPLDFPGGEEAMPRLKLARYLKLAGLVPGRYLLKAHVEDPLHNLIRTIQTSFDVE